MSKGGNLDIKSDIKDIKEKMKNVRDDINEVKNTARDVRSVGASTAIQASLDIEIILKAADWQRLSTVRKHYFKPQKLENLSVILKTVV